MDWQPIETAPRCESRQRHNVLVTMDADVADGYPPITIACLTSHGWVTKCARKKRLWFEPTHWMPLPDPPNMQEYRSRYYATHPPVAGTEER